MISTLHDLKKYVKALVKGTLIGKEMTLVRQKTFVSIRNNIEYGFGIAKIYENWYGHDGAIPGYQSSIYYNTVLSITIVVLTNLQFDQTGAEPATSLSKKIILAVENKK